MPRQHPEERTTRLASVCVCLCLVSPLSVSVCVCLVCVTFKSIRHHLKKHSSIQKQMQLVDSSGPKNRCNQGSQVLGV